ncbi:384c3bb0-2d34-4e17-ab1e-886703354bf3 [Thermothielavioides terrestris]|uniref:384c3bb0-2d34-4e17-ab1e-886703354bf3 n=1 Tax=Thermothielavioides terrestris TaxID=2587410 RepID=A0A446BAD0_9PEZI|nr:384c3bb0-2d34-4e17-ab1e-886703354bf3 [Thermothielavioides terrestris]
MGLREVAIVAEAVAALIGAVTTNHIPATVTVSSLPTVPRIPHPTPVLLPSQAMPNLRSILGTRSTASTMRRKAHRTPPYLSTTTTRIMPLSCININLHTELNLPTKQPLSRPTSRPQFGGDKNRSRNHNQSKGQTAQTAQTTQTPPIQHQKPDAASAGKKKKRKTNTLGLTPGDESDEDDENEEERLNEMYGAEAPNPQTSSEIAAWIAERRARYPTKSRVEAKKAALKAQNGDANQERSSLELKAEKLRKQLEKVESSIKRKREQQDEGDEMRDLDLGSPSSSNAGSDDEKPESMSSRPQPSNVPPPLKKADPTKHCKYYSTGGTCGKRGKCRFVHDPAVREAALRERELNGGRMTLQQRLILNDKDQEDLAIVETLKYLQDKGILPKKTAGAPASDKSSETATAPQSELPARPAEEGSSNGLPPIPPSSSSADDHTTKYAGWNLSGFGNTGVSSN